MKKDTKKRALDAHYNKYKILLHELKLYYRNIYWKIKTQVDIITLFM